MMKNDLLIAVFLLIFTYSAFSQAEEYKWIKIETGAIKVEFTQDDKYLVIFTSKVVGFEIRETETGEVVHFVENARKGGLNHTKDKVVFLQDNQPKLLDLETFEIEEGFDVCPRGISYLNIARESNKAIAQTQKVIYIWDLDTKKLNDSIVFVDTPEFNKKTEGCDFLGKNDDFIFVNILQADYRSDLDPGKKVWMYTLIFDSKTKNVHDSLPSEEVYFTVEAMPSNRDIVASGYRRGGHIDFRNIRTKEKGQRIIDPHPISLFSYEDLAFNTGSFELGVVRSSGALMQFDVETGSVSAEYLRGGLCTQFSNDNSFVSIGGKTAVGLYLNKGKISSVENEQSNPLRINLSNNVLFVEYNSGEFVNNSFGLSIYDITGKEVLPLDGGNITSTDFNKQYDISQLPVGPYLIKLNLGDKSYTKKFIKE